MYKTDSAQDVEINLSGGNNTLLPSQSDSVRKAKYEVIKECYDTLVSTIGGTVQRNANAG